MTTLKFTLIAPYNRTDVVTALKDVFLCRTISPGATPFEFSVECCEEAACREVVARLAGMAVLRSEVQSALDVQEGGTHYKDMKIQPWELFESCLTLEQYQGYLLGTAQAYLMRFNAQGNEAKGGLQDIKKAIHTLQRFVEISEK